jgi:hypothetical protein
MIFKYSNIFIIGIMVLFMSQIASPLKAQTPPSDLTELGIEEILGLRIIRQSDGITYKTWADRWSVGYRYIRVEFDDYHDGSKHISTARVESQFPIVPEKIVQEMHLTEITYNALEKLNLTLTVPYIQQKTDHVSSVAGFEKFGIRTDGIGDISVNASYALKPKGTHHLMANFGISIPSGSIDEKGDTPSPGTRNQLPYTMQLGSGTFDPLFGINYVRNAGRIIWGGGLQGKVRLGRNERGYSLGDRVLLSAWVRSKHFSEWFEPSFKLMASISSTIDGSDADLPRPGLVPVATPRFFGGEKVIASPGVRIKFKDGVFNDMFKGQTIEINGGFPVYQSTNGPLPVEEWRLSIGVNWKF